MTRHVSNYKSLMKTEAVIKKLEQIQPRRRFRGHRPQVPVSGVEAHDPVGKRPPVMLMHHLLEHTG